MMPLDLQYILIAINFFLLVVIFFYAFYLYTIEKKVKRRYSDLTQKSTTIIDEANQKAIEILRKSEFISDDLKTEITTNFDEILKHVKAENEDFYKQWESNYLANSEKMMDDMAAQNKVEMEKVSTKAVETQATLQTQLSDEFNKAKAEIDHYKELKQSEYEAKLSEAIKKIAKEKFYVNLPTDLHKKIVTETLELAVKEVEASTE